MGGVNEPRPIPQIDLKPQLARIRAEIDAALERVLASAA